MFQYSLYTALIIFCFGLIFKGSTWFRYNLGKEDRDITAAKRFGVACKGICLTLFSKKIQILLKVFVFDVLLQTRILKENFLRWLMHMLMFWGFILLFFMHALNRYISEPLFTDYYSTVNPFMFLRDFFGFMVILGIAIAVYRRFVMKVPRRYTHAADHIAIAITAIILISGVFLEGLKITSYSAFTQMNEDYAGLEEETEIQALKSFWVKNFGLVASHVNEPFGEEMLAQGKELHIESCMECHSRPQWAFLGYGTAKIIAPIAPMLDRTQMPTIFWYIHFLASFLGLAYLPFSKMFHIFTSPISLLSNAVMDQAHSDPINIATRQMMELDACTHCGTCSLNCAMGMAFEAVLNINILPSEKITSIKALVAGKNIDEQQLRMIQEGMYLCTNCQRCTVVCPVGINLQELWVNAREALLQNGYPELLILSPLSLHRGLMRDEATQNNYTRPIELIKNRITHEFSLKDVNDNTLTQSHMNKNWKTELRVSVQGNTFTHCFTCKTCTLSCPVVNNYDDPIGSLGLEPHQIMRAAALGIDHIIFSSKMLWTCLGCYQCQENCPQGVQVTDVLYELKNMAFQQLRQTPPTG